MKHKIEFIKQNLELAFKRQNLFLEGLLDYLEDKEEISIDDRERQKEAYKKALQRGSPKDRINAMYEFLLEQDKIRERQIYKPLFDDKFEKKTLGEENYKKICDFARKLKFKN